MAVCTKRYKFILERTFLYVGKHKFSWHEPTQRLKALQEETKLNHKRNKHDCFT